MLPSTVDRVLEQTAEHVNERIRVRMRQRVTRLAAAGPAAIAARLEELDRDFGAET